MLLTVNLIKLLIFSIPKRQTATSNNILQLAPYQPLNSINIWVVRWQTKNSMSVLTYEYEFNRVRWHWFVKTRQL